MNTKVRYSGIQSLLQGLHFNESCHFLCLCSIAEEVNGAPIDFIGVIKLASVHNLIRKDFYVNDACALLSVMTGKTWVQGTASELPETIAANEYTEEVYYNPRTKFTHFKRRGYDTLDSSITVKEGYIKEYRIYRWS